MTAPFVCQDCGAPYEREYAHECDDGLDAARGLGVAILISLVILALLVVAGVVAIHP